MVHGSERSAILAWMTQPAPLVLRPPRDDDAAVAAELDAESLPEALRAHPALGALREVQVRARAASIAAAFPNAETHIVELEGRPVGRLIVAAGADGVHIVEIAVLRSWRRRGVGAALLARLAERFPGMPLTANIFPDNAASLALFAAAGFTLTEGAAQVAARRDNGVIDT